MTRAHPVAPRPRNFLHLRHAIDAATPLQAMLDGWRDWWLVARDAAMLVEESIADGNPNLSHLRAEHARALANIPPVLLTPRSWADTSRGHRVIRIESRTEWMDAHPEEEYRGEGLRGLPSCTKIEPFATSEVWHVIGLLGGLTYLHFNVREDEDRDARVAWHSGARSWYAFHGTDHMNPTRITR